LLEIYNRWGRKVYDKIAYIKEWHGQNQQGESLPDGVYFYHLELPNDQYKQGCILIVFKVFKNSCYLF
jgi:flagellar hook assembly protein FlgD